MIYLVVLFDIVNSGNNDRTHDSWRVLQSSLARCIRQACEVATIPWNELKTEGTGDGMRIIVSRSNEWDWGLFAGPFLDALRAELETHNKTHDEPERFALRAAFDIGEIAQHEDHMVGLVSTDVARLIDAPLLKNALKITQGVLGVIASPTVYRDIIKQSAEYRHTEYRQIPFEVKESRGYAWVRVHGRFVPPVLVLRMGTVVDVLRRPFRKR